MCENEYEVVSGCVGCVCASEVVTVSISLLFVCVCVCVCEWA